MPNLTINHIKSHLQKHRGSSRVAEHAPNGGPAGVRLANEFPGFKHISSGSIFPEEGLVSERAKTRNAPDSALPQRATCSTTAGPPWGLDPDSNVQLPQDTVIENFRQYLHQTKERQQNLYQILKTQLEMQMLELKNLSMAVSSISHVLQRPCAHNKS